MNIQEFTQAKTLNQLTNAIKKNIDNLVVHLVADNCKYVVLISKDDALYIDISVDVLNSHCNRVRITDRILGKEFNNAGQIKGNGYKTFTDYAFDLKRMAWAA